MSSSGQEDLAISFEISHEQQSFRLLELPPALLEVITAPNPPSLSLKSGISGDQNTPNATSSHAVLCTNDQTFHVRQVQSSNSVYLIQPPETPCQDEELPSAKIAVTAVSLCASTLELFPLSTSEVSLRQILPIYGGPLVDPRAGIEKTVESGGKKTIGKQDALENIPLSPYHFNQAWVDVCAFELDGQAWIPSVNSLKGVWKSIICAATAKNINLAGKFLVLDLADMVAEDGFPHALLDAVIEKNRMDGEDLMTDWAVLAKDKCVSWIGGILLETQPILDQGVTESEFLGEWKNQMPEAWRKHAALSALKCEYSHPSKGRIKFGFSSGDPSGAAVVPNTSGKRPGKWHEKFKSTRR